MVFSAELLGMLLLIASAAALGLSIVVDVARVSTEKAREAKTQRQFDKKKAALAEWTQKSAAKHADLITLQARYTEFTGRRQKAQTESRALDLAKIELVHELGEGDVPAFWAKLEVQPTFPLVERRDMIFSRQIWEYRNVAHVRAPSPDQAAAVLDTVFAERTGVRPTAVVPLAMAPEPGAEVAAA